MGPEKVVESSGEGAIMIPGSTSARSMELLQTRNAELQEEVRLLQEKLKTLAKGAKQSVKEEGDESPGITVQAPTIRPA